MVQLPLQRPHLRRTSSCQSNIVTAFTWTWVSGFDHVGDMVFLYIERNLVIHISHGIPVSNYCILFAQVPVYCLQYKPWQEKRPLWPECLACWIFWILKDKTRLLYALEVRCPVTFNWGGWCDLTEFQGDYPYSRQVQMKKESGQLGPAPLHSFYLLHPILEE